MKKEYDFSQGRRGRITQPSAPEPNKTRITIRLDTDVVDRFLSLAEKNATGYQPLINQALREYLDGKAPKFEDTLRQILREELKKHAA
jgi:uncharacterized protein (DUF4415 family)